jgi:hypothetical protein
MTLRQLRNEFTVARKFESADCWPILGWVDSDFGYLESFNGRLRDEMLDRELFLSLTEARVVLDQWRMDYNHRRPHGGLKWLTPAAFVAGLNDTASGAGPSASRGSDRSYAPPSDTPRGLFPNSLMSTGTKTGEGSQSGTAHAHGTG